EMGRGGRFSPKPSAQYTFFEGLAVDRVDRKWGFRNREGDWAIAPELDGAHRFKEGLAWVERNGKRFYIDQTGQTRIELQEVRFDFCGGFSDGLAAAPIPPPQDPQWALYGYIHKTWRGGSEAQINTASPLSKGLAIVTVGPVHDSR